ncbi:hypothetical protein HUT19_08025 [Streptomyces sp. NA02950]|uniref:hypothetical protein n=1 Tax=Streptomyces sp. NA02950 TaxID=2742137 RepID=UPI0015926DBD|nr:hypothetical protein [Streptomyces sp. NA02950]QKV91701.1 hypothetical protein HUT19_08025 [Streptomyces sp. NA02950]
MERWDRAGRWGAYGAAVALTPYALIKVSWVVGSLLGLVPIGEGFDLAGWVVLNTVTIGMAAIGIALALALVRPWGMRLPGRPVMFCGWVGSGFLVSVLPYAVLTALVDSGGGDRGGDRGDGGPGMPGWEAFLVQFGFVGMGLGLAVALPAYLRRRRPDAFTGRVSVRVPWAAGLAAVVGAVWLYWAFGGTLGIAHPARRTTDGAVLTGLGALWALAGAAALLLLSRPPQPRPARRLPLALCWLGSGSLFAWSGWKLPFTLFVALAQPAGATLPEDPSVALVLHGTAVVAGIGMLRALAGPRPARS